MYPDHYHLQQWVREYGYSGLAVLLALGIVGLPVPDETLLTGAGFLAHRGDVSLFATIAAAFIGSATGITISYMLGRTVGARTLERYGPRLGMTDARIARIHRWFHGIGHWALLVGYFVPGVRHFTALVAGISKVEWPTFAAYAYAGGLIWCVTFILLGYFVGQRWHEMLRQLSEHRRLACGILASLLFAYLVLQWFMRRRASTTSS